MSLYTLSEEGKDQKYFTLKLVHGQVIKEHMWSETHIGGGGTGVSSASKKRKDSAS